MRSPRRQLATILLAGLLAAAGAIRADAQFVVKRPSHKEPYRLDTGKHANTGAAKTTVFSDVVAAPGAPWMQLHFSDYNLGEKSYVTMTSALDGGRQRLDSKSMEDWYRFSALFNGDSVLVELHVAPGEKGVFVRIGELTVGEHVGESIPEADGAAESICGTTDDRVSSSDNRVGRITGCTAFLVSNGAILTAGHCADYDPDRGGPLLPDGLLDLAGVLEFNVPASLSNGTTVAADPNDQYPINTASVVWHFDGEGQGLGKDWTVFRCNANSNTGLLPHQAQNAFFRMTRENPVAGNTIRITGYGVDDMPAGSTGGRNSDNRTEQTHTGPYVSEIFRTATDISHTYQVDTTGANSGSPIIWNSNQFTIGIHTNAGCGSSGGSVSGANSGTSFEHNPLEAALQNFPGANTKYLDAVSPPGSPTENGTVFRPYNTLPEAVGAVANNGRILVVRGNYTRANGNTGVLGADGKAFLFLAPVGSALFGN